MYIQIGFKVYAIGSRFFHFKTWYIKCMFSLAKLHKVVYFIKLKIWWQMTLYLKFEHYCGEQKNNSEW